MNATTLLWLRLDFRLSDNPALNAAVRRGGAVVPVFIWSPEEEAPWPPGGASKWWLHQSLAGLDVQLRASGSRLVIRRGPTLETLRGLVKETGATAVFWNRRYEPAVIARDKVVKEALRNEGIEQTEQILFNAGPAGVRSFEVSIVPQPNEENQKNNSVLRLVNVDQRRPKILYLEGEPRWEFKFLKRAVEDDRSIRLITIVRTTQNKTYTQGVDDPKELKDGFPTNVEQFFDFDGLIIGSVDAPYLSNSQQEIMKQFVERRGGGILFLGGRDSLADGGWAKSALNDLLPTILPDRKNTFVRVGANVELTAAGRQSLITRIEEDPAKNVERWKKLPYVMNVQDPGQPRPGAVVLAEAIPMSGGGGRVPLLITDRKSTRLNSSH